MSLDINKTNDGQLIGFQRQVLVIQPSTKPFTEKEKGTRGYGLKTDNSAEKKDEDLKSETKTKRKMTEIWDSEKEGNGEIGKEKEHEN